MLISDKHKLGFIHIPKNAGTSITQWLLDTGDFHRLGTKHDTIQHVSRDLRRDLQWFAVVRNPYERLLSHYNFHVRYYETRMLDPRLARKPKYHTRHQQMQLGFEHYCLHPDDFANRDAKWYDYRYCPQTVWINDSVQLLRFERLDHDFAWVQERVDDTRPLPHANGTPQDNFWYRQHYTAAIRRVVDPLLRTDLVHLGYQW
jgi:hypothetical protein